MLRDFFSLIFPEICLACERSLIKGENFLCLSCQYSLPRQNNNGETEDTLKIRFWGKTEIDFSRSYYSFKKGSHVQNLLYQIKYNGQKECAEYLGKLFGFELKDNPYIQSVNALIPVPLHKSKFKKRGYNQSEFFANGISSALNLPVINGLERISKNQSQTRKSRWGRWENVKDIYQLKRETDLSGLNILLVDDIITTGATCEACTNELLKNGIKSVGIVALALAK